jgi:hypothetical protein
MGKDVTCVTGDFQIAAGEMQLFPDLLCKLIRGKGTFQHGKAPQPLQKAFSALPHQHPVSGTNQQNGAGNHFLWPRFRKNRQIGRVAGYKSVAERGQRATKAIRSPGDANGRPEVHQQRYFPKEKVTFFGTSNGMRLGAGLWGVPPEVDIASYYEGGVTNRDVYVYISQWSEKDPAVLWTKASALFMPVLYNPNGLYVASVIETPGA